MDTQPASRRPAILSVFGALIPFFTLPVVANAQAPAAPIELAFAHCMDRSNPPQAGVQFCTQAIGSERLTAMQVSETYRRRGNLFALTGDFDRAVRDYDSALKADPSNAAAAGDRNSALGLIQSSNQPSTKGEVNAPLANMPAVKQALDRANELRSEADFDGAIQAYNLVLAVVPTLPEALFGRGMAYGWRYEFVPAIRDFSAVLAEDPQHVGALLGRGWVYTAGRDYDRAIRDFTQAIAASPESALPLISRGIAYSVKLEPDQAIEDFTKAISLDPQNADAVFDRGTAYGQTRRFELAIRDLNATIALGPEYADAYRERGMVEQIQGQAEAAFADFSRAIALHPDDAAARSFRAYAELQKLDFPAAAPDLVEAFRLTPRADLALMSYVAAGREGQAAADALTQAYVRLMQLPETPVFRASQPEFEFLLGRLSREQLFAASKTPLEQCPAHFYAAEQSLILGRPPSEARVDFQIASETCIPSSVVQVMAQAELARLK